MIWWEGLARVGQEELALLLLGTGWEELVGRCMIEWEWVESAQSLVTLAYCTGQGEGSWGQSSNSRGPQKNPHCENIIIVNNCIK